MEYHKIISFTLVEPRTAIGNWEDYVDTLEKWINQELNFNLINSSSFDETESESYLIFLEKDDKEYLINFSFKTYRNVQLIIDIFVVNEDVKEIGTENNLHDLKTKIKDKIIRDWQECYWVEDKQSTVLCNKLHLRVYTIENKFRNFINTVLTRVFGYSWWKDLAPLKLKKRYSERIGKYREGITDFKNVNIYLLGLEINDLLSVVNISIEKWNPSFDKNIEEAINENDSSRLISLLKKQMVTEKNLWNDVFERFISHSEFIPKWRNFNDYRNHVAHNKLLDIALYNSIEMLFDELEAIIDNAVSKFNQENLSTEEILQLSNFYIENYLDRVAADTGLNLDEDTILDKFNAMIMEPIDNLRERMEIKGIDNVSQPLINDDCTLLSFCSPVTSSEFSINSECNLEIDFGEMSTLTLTLYENQQLLQSLTIELYNPEIELTEYNTYVINNDFSYDFLEDSFETFFERCIDILDY